MPLVAARAFSTGVEKIVDNGARLLHGGRDHPAEAVERERGGDSPEEDGENQRMWINGGDIQRISTVAA